jgi:serine phosphatase RsbU (regulator of sigma subunit)
LVRYADWIIHTESPAGKLFGIERLRDTVCSAAATGAQELGNPVFERVDRFQAGTFEKTMARTSTRATHKEVEATEKT